MRVVATAGHVDHGKSTLVRALTGIEPDRLAEEKARGMTIDLGFASTILPSGEEVGFIDVPGHSRFVKNMISGVGSLHACLFVVDANEGWKEQSEEHLRILEILGLRHGLVALTKSEIAGPDGVEIAAMVVRERLEGSFLETAEIVAVDAPSGVGLDDLRAALGDLLATVAPFADRGRPRLWVDRRFSIRGTGTVVTGTLTGGTIEIEDNLRIEPAGRQARVRGMQTHHDQIDHADPGRRLAVNLSGVDQRHIARGSALVRPQQWYLSSSFDVEMIVLETAKAPLRSRGAFVVHIGSGAYPARIKLLDRRQAIEPGESGLARIWLSGEARVPVVPGDRYILRESGRSVTVGGGRILDVSPVLPVARARPSISLERVVAERGWVDAAELERLTGERSEPTVGHWVLSPSTKLEMEEQLRTDVRTSGPEGVRLASLSEVQKTVALSGLEGVQVVRDRLFDSSVSSSGPSERADAVLEMLRSARWMPPEIPLSERAILRELEHAGLVCEADGVWFARSAVQEAAVVVAELLEAQPDGFAVGTARDALGTTRKYALPLLGLLDSQGATRRKGDLRVAGPRLGELLSLE
jgi:selenocysteine-specific elongation factor